MTESSSNIILLKTRISGTCYFVFATIITRRWHVTIIMSTGWTPAEASSTLEDWTRTFSRGKQCSCFRITVFYGVRAWSCCHLANENKTCCRLLTDVISVYEFYDAWISGVCRLKFTKHGTRVEQPPVLNKFFFRITIFCRYRD